jgi:hypothetical protein
MKPAIPVGGRTGTAHNPTVSDEWGASPSWDAQSVTGNPTTSIVGGFTDRRLLSITVSREIKRLVA